MSLKIVQNFDSRFSLEPNAKKTLFQLLKSDRFLAQICQQCGCNGVEFTEQLFQPVPYSIETPKGMPKEFEKYHESDSYLLVNVPPPFMFEAKIFKPSRLCAVYRKID
ncbi:hypothetical protein POG22_09965 [Geitlerinema sp. CS-897]|nr:hypothetical protein [Geitlerinema sp. CS-897]